MTEKPTEMGSMLYDAKDASRYIKMRYFFEDGELVDSLYKDIAVINGHWLAEFYKTADTGNDDKYIKDFIMDARGNLDDEIMNDLIIYIKTEKAKIRGKKAV